MDNIPHQIEESEEIIRVLLDPIHIKKENEVKAYAFQPPKDSEDISVNRGKYTTYNLCKTQGLKLQNERNKFWGLGIATFSVLKKVGFSVVYSPDYKNSNLAHSDIKIGEKKIEGEPLSIETTLKIKELIKSLKILRDPFPNEICWELQNK